MDWIERIREEEKAYLAALKATPLDTKSDAFKMLLAYFAVARQEDRLNLNNTVLNAFQNLYRIAAYHHVEDILSGKEGAPQVKTVGDLITEMEKFAAAVTKDLPADFPEEDSAIYRPEGGISSLFAQVPRAEALKICQSCNEHIIHQVDKALTSRREVGG